MSTISISATQVLSFGVFFFLIQEAMTVVKHDSSNDKRCITQYTSIIHNSLALKCYFDLSALCMSRIFYQRIVSGPQFNWSVQGYEKCKLFSWLKFHSFY